jgi:thiamine biosynthesis lipoprotein
MAATVVPAAAVTSVRRRTRAMSCEVTIVVVVDPRTDPPTDPRTDPRTDPPTDAAADPGRLADRAVERIGELEQRWSRFLPTSEISALNDAAGIALRVSPDTVRLVTALVSAWRQTGGAFDPTLLGSLVELGYAASRDDVERRTSLAPDIALRGRPDAVLVDTVHHVVQLPAGTALDPGGLGKGLAADIVVGELLDAGAAGALVEIGGDLRVAGRPPAEGWTIDVDTGLDQRVLVQLLDGGVATSTSRLRTWQVAGERRHHLIDPATLRPSTADAVSCTVVAGSGATAEAFTKVAFTSGPEAAIEQFERHGLAASVTTAAGERLTTTTWGAFEDLRPRTSPITEHPR